MAIKQLTEKQVREWTLDQKDEWWLKNVYKGDMAQLTLRSGLTGAILGSVLSLTNLYIGIRTGWTLGVGITAVILSFAVFKALSALKLAKEMTILENSAMQSIATSAGYMTAPLMASIPGYMIVTGTVPPQWQVYCWMVALCLLGVLFAFPLKKRFINDEQLPFPEGYAAGIVLDNLHNVDPKEGMLKAKILIGSGALSSFVEILRSDILHAIPEYWDDIVYKYANPTIMGTALKDLTIRFDSSIVMLGSGALMSIRTTGSMLLGGIINYWFLAPYMIREGVIAGPGFRNISIWALWGGAAMMTTASIFSFLISGNLIGSFKNLLKPREKKSHHDILKNIELPMRLSFIGVPIMGLIIAYMAHAFFNVEFWLGIMAIPLVFVFSIMAVKSTGLTSVTPGSALAKMTQVVYSVASPGNMGTNLIAAGITSEVSLNASNLLMDIKPAYMLGGKPRQQAIGHIIGVFAGGLMAVPVFYLLFKGDISVFGSEHFPLPGATIWAAVAKVLSTGLSALHPSAQTMVIIGAALGIVMEILIKVTKGRFPITPIGFGLAFVLQFPDILMFFLGSFIFWIFERRPVEKRAGAYKVFVDERESIAAGLIAGGAITGIILMIIVALR